MTQLVITPKVSDKTARFKGTVAAGEHVAVTIKGGAEWLGEDDGANLTLRVLDLVTGRTLAVFPRPAETLEEDETPDAWSEATEDADDLYCELNLNTTRMVAAARHMLRVPVLFVLGDTDDPRTLYFRDRYEIEYWPERIGDTAPYDLDKWPKQIDEWSEQVAQFGEALAGHVGNAVAHVTATERATWNSKYAKPVNGIPANDLADGVRSAIVAVPNKADKATTYTKTEVDALVSGAASGVFVVADSLPATGEANKIYLVPNGSGAAGNVRDEYMWVNGAWELIGSTQVDLSDYYDKTAADGRFVQKEAGKGLFSGSYNDLSDKPTIPAPVTIDPALSPTSENPVQNKAVAAALADKLDKSGGTMTGGLVVAASNSNKAGLEIINGQVMLSEVHQGGGFAVSVQNLLALVATIAGKANASDVATALAQKASLADLPYAMVTPGEWEMINDSEEIYSVYDTPIYGDSIFPSGWSVQASTSDGILYLTSDAPQDALSIVLTNGSHRVTATRASLPGHLLDRAGNLVVVTGDTTLTLPAAVPGYLRDFLVRLEISGSTVPTITFAAPTGETITYETDGDTFPVQDEAGTWLYSFTETAASTFAVALKSVTAVAQGGAS